MITRRDLLGAAALAGGTLLLEGMTPAAHADETQTHAPGDESQDKINGGAERQPSGRREQDYTPVHTPNGATLPFKLVDGVKVMHLVAGEIENEFAPGLSAHCWGYNGRTPGPTIEAVQGDHLRIYVTNRLPEPTTVHWHGIRIPNGMDGVNGLTQEAIPPGQTFRYEFTVPDSGTFMYHPHYDEMTQQAMGLMGMFIVHPRKRTGPPIDRDYVIMLSEWRINPGSRRPVTTEMSDFNIFTMNSKVFPATAPLAAKLSERVRIRFGNLGAMDHHPIHLHGLLMSLVEADGGLIPEAVRRAVNTVLVSPGSTLAVELVADNPGDWPMHCHMSHHAMNQMGHNLPNLIGADSRAIDKTVEPLLSGYMTMGANGMGDDGTMGMPVPKNSIPMLGGKGQFGAIDMGGMFTLIKVREELSGYGDPGDYKFPPGTVSIVATQAELKHDGIDLTVR